LSETIFSYPNSSFTRILKLGSSPEPVEWGLCGVAYSQFRAKITIHPAVAFFYKSNVYYKHSYVGCTQSLEAKISRFNHYLLFGIKMARRAEKSRCVFRAGKLAFAKWIGFRFESILQCWNALYQEN
jgi:hypothetical protein